jgi:preprotein translocase SecE subunit
VARDRQRAKQRKARRAGQNPGPTPSEPHRDNVPGELEHASGEADEFDAALVAGAGGRPADDDDPDARGRAAETEREDAGTMGDEGEPDFDEEDDADLEDERAASGSSSAPPAARAEAPTARGPGRFMAFLRASWAELQRVQWPDRRQVAQATAVVLGFVIVAGVYLGVADRVAQEVVNLII